MSSIPSRLDDLHVALESIHEQTRAPEQVILSLTHRSLREDQEYAVPLWRRRGFFYRGDAFAAFGSFAVASLEDLRVRDVSSGRALPADLTADLGLRLDTYVGIFTVSIANALGRIPF